MEQIYTTLEEREIMVWNFVSKKNCLQKMIESLSNKYTKALFKDLVLEEIEVAKDHKVLTYKFIIINLSNFSSIKQLPYW